ncbi:hypothetical protein GYMLUDRAFT_180498 [Collybiopsis luxurians FD-317 M1]|uniref:Unplaced genomic scaffold GYMLUscaffold_100, whole genome shotgun sequence n=1 Tax=Collybiopsis luxurians FD-317 M1 TaxID=944289 RepID=A0A0D0BCE8_9AGAR|nr:hypothetical protein GYMLUDRAFT_180498 [Collybiopsis luxurians FD-317 M1]
MTTYIYIKFAPNLQYIFTDGVVVWRAWILCKNDSKKTLCFCIFVALCACCSFNTLAAIIIEVVQALTSPEDIKRDNTLTRAINVCHVAILVLSLLTNLSATSIIAVKAWLARGAISRYMFYLTWANGGRILALLIESGLLYSVSLIINLIATVIPLSVGTLGDLCNPINLQIAGMYPLVVLILISQDRSLDSSISMSRHNSAAFTSILELENDQST